MKHFSLFTKLINHPEELFLRLAKLCSRNPIHGILFLCVWCLNWSPQWIAAERADFTLNQILSRFETEWAVKSSLTPAQLSGRLAPLWAALDQPTQPGPSAENASSHNKAAQPLRLGQTRLREHLPATANRVRQMAHGLAARFLSVRIPWGSNEMPGTIHDVFHVEVSEYLNRRVRDPGVTEELAAQSWAAITKRFAEYDPELGRFIVWASYKAKTVLKAHFHRAKLDKVLVSLDANDDPAWAHENHFTPPYGQLLLKTVTWPRHLEPSARQEILLEYLRQYFSRLFQVHKMIADILATMLEYEPLEIVREFRSQTLGAILDLAEEEFVLAYEFPEDEVRGCFDTLRQRLKLGVAQAAKGLHLSKLPRGLGNEIAATTPLADFFTGSDLDEHQEAKQVANWNAEIRRRLAVDLA